MSEYELLQRFRHERSEEAFAQLVRRYAGLVYSVARRRLANAALAEDVAQIVFIRFAKSPPKVASPAQLAAWLHRTTLNVTIDTFRSETRRQNREQRSLLMEPATSDDAIWEEVSPKLDEALNQLNEEDRQTLLLRFFGQKTMRDVGAAIGVSEDAAKMRVSRALEKLRKQLGVATTCTATVLGALLIEHSAEAAPESLITKLSGMKLPAIAGATGIGGLFFTSRKIFTVKLAAAAAIIAVIVIGMIHFVHPAATPLVKNEITNAAAKVSHVPNFAKPRAKLGTSNQIVSDSKAVNIIFHVLDSETGEGLPGTQIHIAYFGPGGIGESHDTMTDDKGDAAILKPDDSSKSLNPNVFVVAEGHVPKAVGFRETVPADYTIKLDPAMTIGGTIVDEELKAVSGVEISIQNPGNQRGQIENVDFQTCPVTNHDDGNWSCSYIPKNYTNEIRLILKKAGYATTFPVVPVRQVQNLQQLCLVVNRGFVVEGTVADSENHPIFNARVKTTFGDHEANLSTKTDQAGFFQLNGITGNSPTQESISPPLMTNSAGVVIIHGLKPLGSPVQVSLSIQAAGFAPMAPVVILNGATNIANFTLSPGNLFRGRITDEAGNPIVNAIVQTDWDNQGERIFPWQTHSDADGRFEWSSAPQEKTLYWFEASGYEVIRDMPLIADGTDHEIVLKPIKSAKN